MGRDRRARSSGAARSRSRLRSSGRPTNARPVVAAEDFAVALLLGNQVRDLGLDVAFEHVPIGGRINLNRDGLIVICGPRLSPAVGKVLASDSALRFERAGDGPWTLQDVRAGKTYRSGPDCQPPAARDIAYLGRLTRPDGKGTVIVFTGIHPQGSLGVAHYLATELPDLYRQVGTKPFSTLLGVDYDPETSEPGGVTRLTPLYGTEP